MSLYEDIDQVRIPSLASVRVTGGELFGRVGDDEAAGDGVVALEVARARQGGRERLVRRAVVRSTVGCLAANMQ